MLATFADSSTSRFHVRVAVIDINDNPPAFEHEAYSVAANRSVAAGSVLVTVKASDPDEGKNADLTYAMADEGTFGRHFALHR